MRRDALEIDRFYRRVKGECAREMALRRMRALWPDLGGLDVLGLGFPGPYLAPYLGDARRAVAAMPAGQGAMRWPEERGAGGLAALADETRLPFKEAQFDRAVLVHVLEEAPSPRPLLRELWRVLAPEGRILVIAAHRAGAWARADDTPFGHGRPYSRRQLSGLLSEALFEPTAWARALYAPPWRWAAGPRLRDVFERAGEIAWPPFGGLILVEAVKHVGAVRGGAPATARLKALEGAPSPALSPARRTRRAPAASPAARNEDRS